MRIFLKPLLAALLLAVSASSVLAQNMKVMQFRELQNDLTANRYGTSKTDQNGDVAALIKIVTPEQGFAFNGGSLGIVETEYKPGEIWLYVPRRAQRLTIQHSAFGVLRDYVYPIPIEGGKTYEMLLDIGTGVYATITASVARSEVFIDGENVGVAPIYNRYLNYGRHTIVAMNGKMEGTVELAVTSDKKTLNVDVRMQDLSHLYGDVRVLVENNADILYGGKKVANGIWDTSLKEGSHVVETQKADHDNSKTTFTVVAGQQNVVNAIAPAPYTGYLSVYTRPQNAIVTDARGKYLDLSEQVPLLVGSHQLRFQSKDYVPQVREYTVERNQVVKDTVELEPVKYFKDFSFYFGGAYTVRSLSGVTGIVGVSYREHDLQLGYTLGLSKSDPVNIYDTSWNFQSRQQYKQSSMSVRYGYRINLTRKMAIVPQVGYTQHSLSAEVTEGSQSFADGASCGAVTIGAKFLAVPVKHVYLFAAPEFGFATSKDESYTTVATGANFPEAGFAAHLGVLAYF